MVYDLRCIYKGNEPSFALETKVRNVSNNINRSLIGNILKSIRVEKNIPMKKIASALKISESTVSQIETGKNSATKEKINEICHVCGCSFDYKTDRKKMIDLVLYRILLHLFIKDYTLAKKYIRQSLSNNSIGKYYKNFFQGLKYLIDNKREKAVDRIESCYNLALTAGEVDRAMLVLKLLNELYLDCRLQNKLRKVKELQENF